MSVTINQLELQIVKIVQETKDTKIIYLDSGGQIVSFEPGQFLTLLFNDNGKEVRRAYSIFTSPSELPLIGIAIKIIDDSHYSKLICEEIETSGKIKILPPMGNFTFRQKDVSREIFFFAGGSGITPIFSLLNHALVSEPYSKVNLIYSSKTKDDIIFYYLIEEKLKLFPNRLRVVYLLSRENSLNGFKSGRITKEFTINYLSNFDNADLSKSDFYLCGPEGMMNNVIDALRERNVLTTQIHREYYRPSISQDFFLQKDKVDRNVTLIFQNETHNINVKFGDSILETALNKGISLPYSCQSGTCKSCKAKLLSGQLHLLDQSALSDKEIEMGYCLTCVGYPLSDNVVIDYDDASNDS